MLNILNEEKKEEVKTIVKNTIEQDTKKVQESIEKDEAKTLDYFYNKIIEGAKVTNRLTLIFIKEKLIEIEARNKNIEEIASKYIKIYNDAIIEKSLHEFQYGRAQKESNLFLLMEAK